MPGRAVADEDDDDDDDDDDEEEEAEEAEEEEEEEAEEEEADPLRVGATFYCATTSKWWTVKKVNKLWPRIEVWPSLSRPRTSQTLTHAHARAGRRWERLLQGDQAEIER